MNADPVKVEARIIDILNAAEAGYGTALTANNRKPHPVTLENPVTQARIESGFEILRAVAMNPQHGLYGALFTLVPINRNDALPQFTGECGIPVIVPFDGAPEVEGVPADPDEVDSYCNDSQATAFYSGALDGAAVVHDQPDANGLPSPVAGKYSIVNGRFKFTGFSARIPLIQLTRSMADTGIPVEYESTLVKLSIPRLVKEGDAVLAMISERYRAWGQEDLIEIVGGAMKVRPVPDIVTAQKQVI